MTTTQSRETNAKEKAAAGSHRPATVPMAERFTSAVMREFASITGQAAELTPQQRRLAQHLFLKIDETLKALERKRAERDPQNKRAPIVWNNINMQRLALDAVHRIDLGLDALIENHVSPIPYWNERIGKYDLDLRVGYKGKDYYRRKFAVEPPLTIIYELVHANDTFVVHKAGVDRPTESYEFTIKNPFDRGPVVGGFAYIVYDDPRKNRLVLVSEESFRKSEAMAKASEFWTKFPVEMRYKTLVHRATDQLQVDPEKISESYAAVEAQDNERVIDAEIEAEANREPVDFDADPADVATADEGEVDHAAAEKEGGPGVDDAQEGAEPEVAAERPTLDW